MTATVRRRRIELLADAPLIRKIVVAASGVGVTHYTILPAASGHGRAGAWSDDQLTGATAKQVFMTVCSHDAADALVDAVTPLLDSHGLMLILSDVDVVRGERF